MELTIRDKHKKKGGKKMKFEAENLYDTIANNYWKMEKGTLKDLLLDLIFVSSEEKIKEALEEYYEREEE